SRAALLTGCYPQRVGIPWVLGPEGPDWTKGRSNVGLNPDEQTIAELLKTKDYATAAIGKWHLGHHEPHLPTKHGFDEFFGIPYSNDMWPEDNPAYKPLTLLQNDIVVDTIKTLEDQAELTGLFTQKAIEFMTKNQHQPFFLYLAQPMPHVPINASNDFLGSSGKGLYADVILEIDAGIGKILETVDILELQENTLVIFTTDNGPWLVYGDHAGSAAPFREGKLTTFEGGVRVPFIAKWPGKIEAGSQSAEVTGLIDLLPTLVEVAEVSLPALEIDGRSIWSLLSDKSKKTPRDVHYFFFDENLEAIRKGKWKLHLPHSYGSVEKAGNGGAKGVGITKEIELSLFDLETDPAESINVANENEEVVQELKDLAEKFSSDMEKNKRKAGISE
ncbi:MAG: sulfatase, partial [Cyclobacteriaceae bacterium]